MQFMGYKTCLVDPDQWMRPMKRSINDFKQNEYVLIYVIDVLAIRYDKTKFLQNIDRYFSLKMGSISDPNIYLGANMNPTRIDNGRVAWYFSPLLYIQEAVKNKEQYVKETIGDLCKIPITTVKTFPCGYDPRLEV